MIFNLFFFNLFTLSNYLYLTIAKYSLWRKTDKQYNIPTRLAFLLRFLFFHLFQICLRKRMWKTRFQKHTATLRGYNMPINNCITPLLLLRIMKEWERWPPSWIYPEMFSINSWHWQESIKPFPCWNMENLQGTSQQEWNFIKTSTS